MVFPLATFMSSCPPVIERTLLVLAFPWPHPLFLLIRAVLRRRGMKIRRLWNIGGMLKTIEIRTIRRKTCPSATFFTANFT
jgi:hypothetical protein